MYMSAKKSCKNAYVCKQIIDNERRRKIPFCSGFDTAAELLIQKGADIDVVGQLRHSPIILAADKGKRILSSERGFNVYVNASHLHFCEQLHDLHTQSQRICEKHVGIRICICI